MFEHFQKFESKWGVGLWGLLLAKEKLSTFHIRNLENNFWVLLWRSVVRKRSPTSPPSLFSTKTKLNHWNIYTYQLVDNLAIWSNDGIIQKRIDKRKNLKFNKGRRVEVPSFAKKTQNSKTYRNGEIVSECVDDEVIRVVDRWQITSGLFLEPLQTRHPLSNYIYRDWDW